MTSSKRNYRIRKARARLAEPRLTEAEKGEIIKTTWLVGHGAMGMDDNLDRVAMIGKRRKK